MVRVKYPRTPHLPASPGATADDKVLRHVIAWHGRQVVVTEKLDGQNVTLTRDYLHARSTDAASHPSQTRVRALHAQIAYRIEPGWRLVGENMQAVHTVRYTQLPGPLVLFAAFDPAGRCVAFDELTAIAADLDLPAVPVVWRGPFDERHIDQLARDLLAGGGAWTDTPEGLVVRTAGSFDQDRFADNVAKWVRAGHVPAAAAHWSSGPLEENGFAT